MGPDFHHRFHKSPLLVPILSQNNLVHALPTDFFKIRFNKVVELLKHSVFDLQHVFGVFL
jgi:hypothetical protein